VLVLVLGGTLFLSLVTFVTRKATVAKLGFCLSDFEINYLGSQRLKSFSMINDIKEYKSKWGRNMKTGRRDQL
jgi:hypothetical protein